MAKIYETQKDFERDVLKEQAHQMQHASDTQSARGISFIAASFIADLFHSRKPETRGWLRYAGSLLAFFGIVDVVRSWFTQSKATDLKLKQEFMGPETVVLPPGDVIDVEAVDVTSRAAKKKSLLDFAAKKHDCGCPGKDH